MKVKNPKNIKQAEIIIGIPSYNEEKTIGFVAEQASLGLEKYFPDKSKVIINLDNNSKDQTETAFFSSNTKVPKIYLSAQPGKQGKGYNFYNLFIIAKKLKTEKIVVLDADLRSVRANWIKKMIQPLEQGYDYVTPYYIRCKTDATITNHLIYPLIYGIWGYDLRQPIGGDFAFKAELADYWLKQKWNQEVFQYGIDIFMTLHAILGNFKINQVNLGAKLHNLSTPKLGQMFYQVTNTFFNLIWEYKEKIKKDCLIKKIDLIGGTGLPILANAHPNKQTFQKSFNQGLKKYWKQIKELVSPKALEELKLIKQKEKNRISLELWIKLVYDFLLAYPKAKNKQELINILGCLYFGRAASFFDQNKDLTPEQTERKVRQRAKIFFKLRNYFINQI